MGMPQTSDQSELFRALSKDGVNLEEKLKQFFSGKDLSKMVSFLKVLDGNKDDSGNLRISDDDLREMKNIYRHSDDDQLLRNRILELRRDYDWNAAKKIIKICPCQKDDRDDLIRDLYSIIDKKLLNNQSIKVLADDDKEEILPTSRLQGARNFLTLFINMLFAAAWHKITQGEKDAEFEKYKTFLNTFGKMMQDEGHRFFAKGYEANARDFYLFTCSFVSLNFEMVFPWILMNSHRELNAEQKTFIKGHPIKLWLDFGVEYRGRKTDNDEENLISTLEFTESVAGRENEDDHIGTPLNRAGKFYFAHGSSNWRECPVCGRMTFCNGGNHWEYKSKKLIPPFPIPFFEYEDYELLTKQEWHWRKNLLHFDSMQCMYCESETFAHSAPMIMQTSYKSTPTSFLEEIQRNVKVSLEKARHIVLLGYQLPPDDVVWQQTFAEAVRCRINSKNKAYCTVVVGYKGEKRWLDKNELENYVFEHKKNEDAESYGVPAIENAWAIFGKENVRAWTGGIPEVFGNCAEADVNELLYPDFVEWKGTRLER